MQQIINEPPLSAVWRSPQIYFSECVAKLLYLVGLPFCQIYIPKLGIPLPQWDSLWPTSYWILQTCTSILVLMCEANFKTFLYSSCDLTAELFVWGLAHGTGLPPTLQIIEEKKSLPIPNKSLINSPTPLKSSMYG